MRELKRAIWRSKLAKGETSLSWQEFNRKSRKRG